MDLALEYPPIIPDQTDAINYQVDDIPGITGLLHRIVNWQGLAAIPADYLPHLPVTQFANIT